MQIQNKENNLDEDEHTKLIKSLPSFKNGASRRGFSHEPQRKILNPNLKQKENIVAPTSFLNRENLKDSDTN